jgi:hypothetical protein
MDFKVGWLLVKCACLADYHMSNVYDLRAGSAFTPPGNHEHVQMNVLCVDDLCRRPTAVINHLAPLGPNCLHPFPRQLVNLSYLFIRQPACQKQTTLTCCWWYACSLTATRDIAEPPDYEQINV